MTSILRKASMSLGKATYLITAAAIALVCFLTIIDTVSRSIGTGSIALVFDLNESLIVVAAFLPLAFAQLSGDHVAFTALYSRMPKRIQDLSRLLGYLLALPLVGWITWVSLSAAVRSWQVAETRMGVSDLPVWPARLAVVVGMFAFFLTLVYGILAVINRWAEFPLREMVKDDAAVAEAGSIAAGRETPQVEGQRTNREGRDE